MSHSFAPKHPSLRGSHCISIAPMMEWTDRFCRFYLRLLTRHAVLYTEMVTSGAVLHGDRQKLLRFHDAEHPVVLQLGGSDPRDLALAARVGEEWGYDEINLNVGCPSDRVKSGCFGAALMAEPQLVAECIKAMRDAVSIPVTVKCRIGIDDMDIEGPLDEFVGLVSSAGASRFIIHARKAWLKGLSPKENREVPPLNYDRVYRLKQCFPDLPIVINGGIETLDEADVHLALVDGVMIGRAAYQNSFELAGVDQRFYGDESAEPTRGDVVERLVPFVEDEMANGARFNQIARHVLGLYQGVPGARSWRRHISENATKPGSGAHVLLEARDLAERDRGRSAVAV